jgi:hypothetical protein
MPRHVVADEIEQGRLVKLKLPRTHRLTICFTPCGERTLVLGPLPHGCSMHLRCVCRNRAQSLQADVRVRGREARCGPRSVFAGQPLQRVWRSVLAPHAEQVAYGLVQQQ